MVTRTPYDQLSAPCGSVSLCPKVDHLGLCWVRGWLAPTMLSPPFPPLFSSYPAQEWERYSRTTHVHDAVMKTQGQMVVTAHISLCRLLFPVFLVFSEEYLPKPLHFAFLLVSHRSGPGLPSVPWGKIASGVSRWLYVGGRTSWGAGLWLVPQSRSASFQRRDKVLISTDWNDFNNKQHSNYATPFTVSSFCSSSYLWSSMGWNIKCKIKEMNDLCFKIHTTFSSMMKSLTAFPACPGQESSLCPANPNPVTAR